MRSVRFPSWESCLVVGSVTAIVAGAFVIRNGPFGFRLTAALSGVGSQLHTTLPAAVLVAAAAALDVAVGAFAVRALRGGPYSSWLHAASEGFAGAVLIDALGLGTLGSIGWFRFLPMAPLLVALVLIAWLRRDRLHPFVLAPAEVAHGSRRPRPALVPLVWMAPLILLLASPVVPFVDVLPNHVAPIQHLQTYGSMQSLAAMPSPIYGPSRQFIGYVALLGVVAVTALRPAPLAVAAFVLPVTVLMGVSAIHLMRSLLGRRSLPFVLFTLPLTFVFLRMPDDRATSVAFIATAAAFACLFTEPGPARRASMFATCAAGILVHPTVGTLTVIAILGVALVESMTMTPFEDAIPACAAALVAGAPQYLTTAGATPPTWTLGACVALGGLGVWATRRRRFVLTRPLAIAVSAAIGVALVVVAARSAGTFAHQIVDTAQRFPVLAVVGFGGLAAAPTRVRRPLVVALASACLAVTVPLAFAPNGTPLFESWHQEIPSTFGYYWMPWLLAVAASLLVAYVWDARRLRALAHLLVLAFVVVAALPLRWSRAGIDDPQEHRYAEILAISLHHAERGYWQNFPDARQLIDAPRRQIVSFVAERQRTGRLRSNDGVLQIAPSFEQWDRTPLDMFTGAMVTSASRDPEYSRHTAGGRLHNISELDGLLTEHFRMVVAEGAEVAPTRAAIESAGYRLVFTNSRGAVYEA